MLVAQAGVQREWGYRTLVYEPGADALQYAVGSRWRTRVAWKAKKRTGCLIRTSTLVNRPGMGIGDRLI